MPEGQQNGVWADSSWGGVGYHTFIQLTPQPIIVIAVSGGTIHELKLALKISLSHFTDVSSSFLHIQSAKVDKRVIFLTIRKAVFEEMMRFVRVI